MPIVFIVGIILLIAAIFAYALLKPPPRKKKSVEDRIHSSVRHQPADEQFTEPPAPSIPKKEKEK